MADTRTLPAEGDSRTAADAKTEKSANLGAFPAQNGPAVPQTAESAASNVEGFAVLLVGVAFFLGVFFQFSPLNGSVPLINWIWPWRNDIGILRAAAFLLLPFACIAYVLWRVQTRSSLRVSIPLGILASANFLLQILGILADRRGIRLIQQIVLSPGATSYFFDASRIRNLAGVLRHFDQVQLTSHSTTHPAGPILFYYLFLRLFGVSAGAFIAGLAVGALASLGALVTYLFAGLWTECQRTRLIASAFYALLPALMLFFPELDQVYPIFSMLLILFWCKSLESKQRLPWEGVYLGVIFFLATFFAYNLLTILAFLAFYSLYWLWRQGWAKPSVIAVARNSGIAAGVMTLIYSGLWAIAGYNPIAAFLKATTNQRIEDVMVMHRAGNWFFALFDPYDFLMGAGILVLPLIAFQLFRMSRNLDLRRKEVALTLIGFATILTIDLTGALRGETARLWLFLQPLVVVPAALELSRFRSRWLLAIFCMQWLMLVCLKAKMLFVNPELF